MRLAGAIAEATIDLDADGMPARVVDGDGVIEMRATEAQVGEPFPAVDLIAATSVPIGGVPGDRLVLDGDVALPPVPGQDARPTTAGVEVELSARLPGAMPAGAHGRDRSDDITALVKAVQARIEPDLATGTQSAKDAASANAGDCTTYALAYAALATERGIPTRIVTGFRLDASRLIRHRWAVSWTGRSWIAVDAAFGAAPAGGDLVGLAVHDADDAGLVAGEAALTQVRGASWR
jgi:transglutaminase-like putative cysteine protease